MGVLITTGILAGLKLSTVILLASMAYQIIQAKKMRKAARDAAEARKGFEVVVDGNIQTLPIIYGRALVGGTRVYHNTSGIFTYTANNSDKIFQTGPTAIGGGSYTSVVGYDEQGNPITQTTNYSGLDGGLLNKSYTGQKNEFLFFQQALCQAPINAVHDVIIDESRYLDDPVLGTSTNDSIPVSDRQAKAAMRIDLHYNGGVDNLIKANFNERATATFSEVAYASAVIRLDRDEPQFNSVPQLQFLIEGRKVKTLTNGVLSQNRVYTNNPVWCLLDYLLDTRSGKGLNLAQIHTASFESAAAICNTIVQNSVSVGGKFYNNTDNSRNITTRNLPLYECNIIIDTSKQIRENISAILATMGDARLVWSQGQYKLLLQYPATNNDIQLAATITDDDLILDQDIDITWPSSDERLNSCTVRFHNETENFKEDSVTWPPKGSGPFAKGIGGKKYTPVSGWDDTRIGNRLLNNYGIWSTTNTVTSYSWKIVPLVSGTYTLRIQPSQTATITLGSLNSTFNYNADSDNTASVSLTANQEYTISIGATSNNNPKGIGATLTGPDSVVIWTTRSDSYDYFINTTLSDALYQQFLNEDNNVELETDIFAEGITDYYHALAKAEELVRTSRSAFSIKFKYVVKNQYLEPGDIIRLNSSTLNIGLNGNLYIRVNQVNLLDGAICEVAGARFDYSQLAWNVKDDEYIKPQNAYDFVLRPPQYLNYSQSTELIAGSSGVLSWGEVPGENVAGYVLYIHVKDDLDSNNRPIFKEIGRSRNSPFYLPPLNVKNAIFGIRTYSVSGILSAMVTTSVSQTVEVAAGPTPPVATNLVTTLFGTQNQSIKLTWTIPTLRADSSDYNDHFITYIYRNKQETPLIINNIGSSEVNSFIDTPTEYGNLQYRVALVSYRGAIGPKSAASNISINFWNTFVDTQAPPAPTNLTASSALSTVLLSWTIPNYTIGGGHKSTLIYAREWPEGQAQPTLESSSPVANIETLSFYSFSGDPSTRYVFWIKEVSQGGGISVGFAGPVVTTTGLNVDRLLSTLANRISESEINSFLNSRIDQIDDPVNGLLKKTADLETVFGSTASAAQSATNASLSSAEAIQAKVLAEIAQISAANSKDLALQYKEASETAKISAETSAASSELSRTQSAQSAITAESAAASASNSSNLSVQSSNNALLSEQNAAVSEGNALVYESNASISETNAANSATSASNSAANAFNSATLAVNSSSNALASEQNAKASENNSLVYQSNASISETNAASSATSASNSASNAFNSATLAVNSSSNALISEQNAATSESNALVYESNANISETNAASSATSASSSSANAATSANLSASSANSASISANASATSATEAASFSSAAESASSISQSAQIQATASQVAAEIAAIAAQSSSISASASASSAGQFASFAETQGSLAATSAANASVSESAALNSETLANGYAQSAANTLTRVQAVATGFDALKAWNFDSTIENWNATFGNLSAANSALTVLNTAGFSLLTNETFTINGNPFTIIPTLHNKVRMRVRRTPGSGGTGKFLGLFTFKSTSVNYDLGLLPEGVDSILQLTENWQTIEWDLTSSTDSFYTEWTTTGPITGIRFWAGSGNGTSIDIDWITIGRSAPIEYKGLIETEASVRASADGQINAKYGVKVNAAGHVAGFGLIAESNTAGGTTSSFLVQADTFAITPVPVVAASAPTTNLYVGKIWFDTVNQVTKYYSITGSPPAGVWTTTPQILPFVVETGASGSIPAGVYINNAIIKDASITAAKIGSVNADVINTGTLNAARIGAGAITADKLNLTSGTVRFPSTGNNYVIIDGNNNRIEVYNQGVLRVRLGNLA